MPSTSARAFLRIALAAVVVAVFAHTRADPDLWGHVRFGHDLVAARGARLADTYSFDTDRPWINHEWLAEILMYGAFAAGGGAGLIALKILLLIAMTVAVSMAIRAGPIAAPTHDLLIGLLLVGTVPQASHVRPQLFSLVAFAWLLAVLLAARRRRRGLVLAAIPIMALWANLHGGWIVGAGVLFVWCGGRLAVDGAPRREKVMVTAAVVGALLATLVNPEGWRLWAFLRDTVGAGRADIVDWQPVYRLGPAYGLLWALVLAAAITGTWAAVRRHAFDPPAVAVVAMLAVAAFRVNRLLAFFAIAVVMLLHRQLAFALESWRRAEERPSAFRSAAAIVIGCIVVAGSTAAAARNATCVHVEAADYPEPQVARLVNAAGLHGRMLTWFSWGEYAIWHFAPSIKVSMDGRRETVYTDAAIRQHLLFYFLPQRRQALIDALAPDYIWLPSDLAVVRALQADGWHTLFAGDRSVLLSRAGTPAVTRSLDQSAPRCFPGP